MTRKDLNLEWKFPKKEEIITLRDSIGNLPPLDPLLREGEEFTEKKFQLMPEEYLDSTRSLVQEMKIFNDSAEPLKETQDFKELLNDTLRNMNYNNSFQTKKRIMKMTNHIMKIYGSCIRDFYEKQLFSS